MRRLALPHSLHITNPTGHKPERGPSPGSRCAPLESRATFPGLDSTSSDFDTSYRDKGKPVERRGRKATGLTDGSYDGGAANGSRDSACPIALPTALESRPLACG